MIRTHGWWLFPAVVLGITVIVNVGFAWVAIGGNDPVADSYRQAER